MKFGKMFFLVSSKREVDLLDKNLILLFGATQDFKNKINKAYPRTTWSDDGLAVSKTDNAVLDFYISDEEVIEKFVMVDVLYTEDPFKEI